MSQFAGKKNCLKITPEFIIDNRGFPICKKHTMYNDFLLKKEKNPYLKFKDHNCLDCEHYKRDNCELKSEKIKRLKKNQKKRKCILCGRTILDLNAIIYSEILKQQNGIEVPLLCCSCYMGLDQEKMETAFKNAKKYYLNSIGLSFVAIFFGIGLLMSYSSFEDGFDASLENIFNWITSFLLIIVLIYSFILIVRLFIGIFIYLKRGKTYYNNFFGYQLK